MMQTKKPMKVKKQKLKIMKNLCNNNKKTRMMLKEVNRLKLQMGNIRNSLKLMKSKEMKIINLYLKNKKKRKIKKIENIN